MKNRHTAPSPSLPIVRPHNRFVMPALFRRAGSHRPGVAALRQQELRALKREIDDLHPPHR